jgi:hypothetical protein
MKSTLSPLAGSGGEQLTHLSAQPQARAQTGETTEKLTINKRKKRKEKKKIIFKPAAWCCCLLLNFFLFSEVSLLCPDGALHILGRTAFFNQNKGVWVYYAFYSEYF